ncbi:MAG TPA: hydrogenase maturation protease [Terriglobales bacterium]|nr:hydrogenase maturation protease [Terriglobales bacterium]
MSGKVLIAGVGNIFLGDDAFGVEVLRRLSQRELPEQVCARDFGIRGFDLAYALMEPWELVVLLDATQRGGVPGTVYVIEHKANDNTEARMSLEPHGMHPVRALDLISAMGSRAPRTVVIGCEPEDLGGEGGRMGLSPAVAASIDEAANLALRLASECVNAVAI